GQPRHQAARARDAQRRGRQEPRGRRQDLVPLGPRRRRGAHPRRQARRQLPGRAGRGRQRPRRTRPLLRQVAGGRLLAEGQPRRRRDLALGRRAAARPLGERGRRGRGRRAGHGVARGEPPLPAAVLGGAERRPPCRARRADGGRRRRGELRRRAQPLRRARHRVRGAQARRREPEPAARPRGAYDDGRRLRRQPRPRPQVRLRGDTMTPHAHPNARVLAIVAVLLAALTGLAAAQSWEPQGEIEVLTGEVMVGETAQVLVHFEPGLDFDPTLYWGDGTWDDVDRFGWPTVALEHVYTTPGLKTLEVRLEAMGDAYLMDTQYLYVRPEPELDLSATSLLVGETVTATVVGGPEGGRLEWGDGAFEVLGGFEVEEYEHAYGAPGVYTVRLLDWGGDTLVTAFVNVTTGALTFDLDPVGDVGEPVGLTIEGLAGNAPDGARLSWGDGSVEVVDEDGEYAHVYTTAGAFTVSLRRLPDDQLLAQGVTTIGAAGYLDAPGVVTLFEPVSVAASGLAPGLTYRLDYGDGQFDLLTADGAGSLEVEHTFELPRSTFALELRLAEAG